MFRGDHEKKRPIPSGAVPVFFADAASAYIYTRGDGSKLSMFRVTNKPKLFVLSYKNLVKMFDDERLDEEEKLSLEAFLKPGSPPYIIPVDFLKREDAVAEHKLYLNRRILNIVCRLGFDGWIAFPDTLAQRNMDIPYYKVTGKMRFRLNPYNSEIAICHWATFLEAA